MSNQREFVIAMKAKLDEWNREIDALEIKARRAKASVDEVYAEQIEELKQQRRRARTKLAEVENAADDAWEVFKDGIEKTWDNLKTTLKDTKASIHEGLRVDFRSKGDAESHED